MIDILALAISHGLLAVAVWRLMWRDDLFHDDGAPLRRVRGGVREMNGPAAGDAEAESDSDA